MRSTSCGLAFCAVFMSEVWTLSTDFRQHGTSQAERLFNETTVEKVAPQMIGSLRATVTRWGSRITHDNGKQLLPSSTKYNSTRSNKTRENFFGSSEAPPQTIAMYKHGLEETRTSGFAIGAAIFFLAMVLIGVCCPFSPPEEQPLPRPHSDLVDIDACDGTWNTNYKAAVGQEKEALEMLFRCHIIPQQEFAHSRVTQEHVDECKWIAISMLKDRKLEEWMAMCPEAQKTFEESVTDLFRERAAVRTERSIQRRTFNSPAGSGFADYNAPASKELPEKGTPPGTTPDVGKKKTKQLAILKSAAGRDQLINRCREIMAASDRDKRQVFTDDAVTPTSAAHGAASAASSTPRGGSVSPVRVTPPGTALDQQPLLTPMDRAMSGIPRIDTSATGEHPSMFSSLKFP